jgi:PDZ domain
MIRELRDWSIFHEQPFWFREANREVTFARPEACQAGLRAGDRILAIDGKSFENAAVLDDALEHHRAGGVLQVTFARPGEAPSTNRLCGAAVRFVPRRSRHGEAAFARTAPRDGIFRRRKLLDPGSAARRAEHAQSAPLGSTNEFLYLN